MFTKLISLSVLSIMLSGCLSPNNHCPKLQLVFTYCEGNQCKEYVAKKYYNDDKTRLKQCMTDGNELHDFWDVSWHCSKPEEFLASYTSTYKE